MDRGLSCSGYSGHWVEEITKFDKDLSKRMIAISGHERRIELEKAEEHLINRIVGRVFTAKAPKMAHLYEHRQTVLDWQSRHLEYYKAYRRWYDSFKSRGIKPQRLGHGGFKKIFEAGAYPPPRVHRYPQNPERKKAYRRWYYSYTRQGKTPPHCGFQAVWEADTYPRKTTSYPDQRKPKKPKT